MRRLFSAIKGFFFPPAGSPLWVRLLPFALLGVLSVAAVSGGVYGWTYTNSPEFCGTVCHTMPPEFSAYQRSPHARVQCVECHLGRDVVTTQFTRKAGDLRHVVRTVTQDYEFPIYAHEMRPARDSCERCHFPEKFSDDSLREIRHYGDDEDNSLEQIYLILKTGGGSRREGLGRGIHWHIENEVWYLADDVLEQNIPYVRTVEDDGQVTEYYDLAAGITPDDVAGSTLARMDCITCHNRITHSIPTPEGAVDQALAKQLLPADLPDIREQAVAYVRGPYQGDGAVEAATAQLLDFYDQNYPQVRQEREEEIQQAAATLAEIQPQLLFPEQKIDWETHPDNLGHKDFPGCFRCHDGKHLTGEGEAIRLECNLCHSVPVLAEPGELVTNIELAQGPEPASHTHTSWITLHGQAIDSSCAACHEPPAEGLDYTELEGKPPAGDYFCGNAACHGPDWQYAGFDSPALAPVLERQLRVLKNSSPYLLDGVARDYENTFATLFAGRCVFCHGGAEPEAGLDLSQYEGMLAGGQNGPALVPGDPAASLIVQKQTAGRDHFGQLLPQEVEAVVEWIEAGAP